MSSHEKLPGKYASSLFAMSLAVALVTAGAARADCAPKHTFTTIQPGTLTIAVTTYAPYSYMEENGQPGGVDDDIANAIAAMECLKVVGVPIVGGAGGLQYVLSGKADITVGDWYRTAERAKVANLSAPLYIDQMGIYSKEGYSTVQDLVGKQVGTGIGMLWDNDLKKLLGDNLHLYADDEQLHMDITAGRIDVAVDSYSDGVVMQKAGKLQGLQIKSVAPDQRVAASMKAAQATFPYAKSNTGLGKALDDDIAALRADGTIAKILEAHGLNGSAADTGAPTLIE